MEEDTTDTGWQEIEETLSAVELPPLPPTSDPQRLLNYVLNILPRYTQMEMLSTHLRLYSSTLEQDMEQLKSHVRILSREVEGEKEKRQFLERYAAQVVKERNDLLHGKVSKLQKKGGSVHTHFAWHSCCKKNANHSLDMTPSIVSFRGEKLQEALKELAILQEEMRNQVQLRKELDLLLKKTQREHDCKVVADRKHIQQLEKQLLQRSILHSSLERKMYDVESTLARHDTIKNEELSVINNALGDAKSRLQELDHENSTLSTHIDRVTAERDKLTAILSDVRMSKDALAQQVDLLSQKCSSMESEMEALRSEVDVLQSKDINNVRVEYTTRIQKLQQDFIAKEQQMLQEIDRLRLELTKREAAVRSSRHNFSIVRESPVLSSIDVPDRATSIMDISLPLNADWSKDLPNESLFLEDHAMGSSLSRSQLSDSACSLPSSPDNQQQHVNSSQELHHVQMVSDTIKSESSDVGNDEYFDWEAFIDSASDSSTPKVMRATLLNRTPEEQKINGQEGVMQTKTQFSSSDSNSHFRTDEHQHDDYSTNSSFVSEDTFEHEDTNSVPEDVSAEEQKESDIESDSDLVKDLRGMLHEMEKKRIEEEEKAAHAEQALLEFQKMHHEIQELKLISPK